jgi:hypothetical protein
MLLFFLSSNRSASLYLIFCRVPGALNLQRTVLRMFFLFNQFALFETHFVGFYAIKRLIYSVQCLRISVVSSYIIRIKVTGWVALSWFVSDDVFLLLRMEPVVAFQIAEPQLPVRYSYHIQLSVLNSQGNK